MLFERYYNETELARRWNLSRRTLQKYRWTGRGPRFHKIEGAVRYSETDVLEYEAERSRSSTGDKRGRA